MITNHERVAELTRLDAKAPDGNAWFTPNREHEKAPIPTEEITRNWGTLVPFSQGEAAVHLAGLLRTWDTVRNTARSVPAPSTKILHRVIKGLGGGEGLSLASSPANNGLRVEAAADTTELPNREPGTSIPDTDMPSGFFEPVTPVESPAPTAESSVQPPQQEA